MYADNTNKEANRIIKFNSRGKVTIKIFNNKSLAKNPVNGGTPAKFKKFKKEKILTAFLR